MTWAKGHAGNRHINAADLASTLARSGSATLDVDYCLLQGGVEWTCGHAFDAVQLDTPLGHIAQVTKCARDVSLRCKVREQAPQECTNTRALRRLMYVPGACDILQALVRRAVLPVGTKELCVVHGCGERATAAHVLLCNSSAHKATMSRHADGEVVFGSVPPSLPRLLRDFVAREPAVLLYVAERLLLQEVEDTVLRGWCFALRSWVMLRHEYRER